MEVRNRFKGLDLIDRVPDETWIVSWFMTSYRSQGARSSLRKKKKCKKAKWLSEEALQTAAQRREATGKGEKERYTDLNAEHQRIARRDRKDFFSDQQRNRGK